MTRPQAWTLLVIGAVLAACNAEAAKDSAATDDVGTDGTDGSDGGTDPAASGPDSFAEPLTGMVFHRIAPSSFEMGCTAGQSNCGADESPVMPVTLTYAHYMGETEVTQAQFEAAMGYNPSYFTRCADCPVERITWHEATALSNALSSAAGLEPCYPCRGSGADVVCDTTADLSSCEGYRLPTEAEWEGAARCGADTLYAGSNEQNEVAWTGDNAPNETHPVGRKAANACGLYDMSGNVWEWVSDWENGDYYRSSGRRDPEGPVSGSDRVRRGGSWSLAPQYARVAARSSLTPGYRDFRLGVRLLRTAP